MASAPKHGKYRRPAARRRADRESEVRPLAWALLHGSLLTWYARTLRLKKNGNENAFLVCKMRCYVFSVFKLIIRIRSLNQNAESVEFPFPVSLQ